MADYTQYNGSVTASYASRLLDNGSDYIAVKISNTKTLFVQGLLDRSNNVVSYSGESWVYDSSVSSLTYLEHDSGQITLTNELYVYSNLRGFQRVEVNDVFPRFIFFALFALILVLIGFNVVRKRWIL